MNNILEFLQSMVSSSQAQVLVWLILANLVLGTVAALKTGEFQIARFKDFGKRVIIVFGTYLGVSIASRGIADYNPLRDVCWAALIAYLGTQLISNLKDIGVLPLPESINKFIERS